MAEVTGNLKALLDLDESLGNAGAGSPTPSVAHIADDIAVA